MTLDAKVAEILRPLEEAGVYLSIFETANPDKPIKGARVLVYVHRDYVEIMPKKPTHYLTPEFIPETSPARITSWDQNAGKYEITVPGCSYRFDVYNKTQPRTEKPVGRK